MKRLFLDKCLSAIKNKRKDISTDELDEIRYGLEGIYLTITKTIVIFGLSIVLGIFKEMIIMLIVFNILRTTGFGLHAKKSWQCWVSSIIMFIFLPILSKYIIINSLIKLILGILSIILIYLYAPADTKKHPLVNEKKRTILKFITTIECIVLVSIMLFTKNNIISNLILFGIYIEIILINPLSYKIFKLDYNNYLNYVLSNNA